MKAQIREFVLCASSILLVFPIFQGISRAQAQDNAVNGWLDGAPAVITRKVGRGTITYFGIWMDDHGMKEAAEWMLNMSGVHAEFSRVPNGVEVDRRVGVDKKIFFIENFSDAAQTISFPGAMRNILTGQVQASASLPVFGVAILEQKKQ